MKGLPARPQLLNILDYMPLWKLAFNQHSEHCHREEPELSSHSGPLKQLPSSLHRQLIAEDKYPTVSFIRCEGKTFAFFLCKDVWLRCELDHLAKHHKAFISKPETERSRWHCPALFVIKMNIKCWKSRRHAKDLFSFLLLLLFFCCGES